MPLSLRRWEFSRLPGWAEDSPAAAFDAFCRSARRALETAPYKPGSLGLTHGDFEPAFKAALALKDRGSADETTIRAFFEDRFYPFELCSDDLRGLVTGYYEPEIEVCDEPGEKFRYPFLRKPEHLVKVPDPARPPPGIPEGHAYMLERDGRFEVCPDRREIEAGAFDGMGLEIAWASSRVDVFFAHVQGCARLHGSGRPVRRITYDGKSGHPFTGIGRLLVNAGEIAADEISMASIRAWLARHPGRADELMRQNRSFIFFREADVDDLRLGPVAAAKVPLEPGRSMAVDKHIHTFGTPIFVSVPDLEDFDAPGPFARLMVAQDTGTAIVGPARGDLFAGSGPQAGDKAGAINNRASFFVLAPKSSDLARRTAS
ncbi:MAG: MltA domain-containing protein [Hoeflea sp.]|uniref:murein transglycosylase A n=1 Tax=Hoeflea sp. TaxID=1940281 RepID=UPI0032EDD0E4